MSHTPANTPSQQRSFTLSDFDFHLPDALIAQHPAIERSASRLLDGRTATPTNRIFKDIASILEPNDLLIFNDTKVIKARLFGQKSTGGKLELLVERVLPDTAEQKNRVVAHIKVSKKPLPHSVLQMAGGFEARFINRWPDENGRLFEFEFSSDPYELMQNHGHVPLPPYITHSSTAEDETRYQTIFAKHQGAVAAPTAALHFDEALLQTLQNKGVQTASVTLHVGAGTFAPVKVEDISQHHMHFERYEVPQQTIAAIQNCRAQKGRIIAVGTTTIRALESWAKNKETQGDTNIFITPGFQFQIANMLLTNFHLPKSTLMMLVSAFAGYEHIMQLYAYAIAEKYRFFSYGDAMLLVCQSLESNA